MSLDAAPDAAKTALITTIPVSMLMVVTGTCNTLLAKWADRIYVDGVPFEHPFFQSFCMFLGEFSCLWVYFILQWLRKRHWKQGRSDGLVGNGNGEFTASSLGDANGEEQEPTLMPSHFNPMVFMAPVCCDVTASFLMFTALNLTSASSYQMLRGSAIIFTGLFSIIFLRAKLLGFRWLGMGLVAVGLAIVGWSDIAMDDSPGDDTNAIMTGNLLIVLAQVMTAAQMVTEQKFLVQYDVPPLFAVGIEGLFGMVIVAMLMVPMHFIRVPATFSKNPDHRLEDIAFAFRQIAEQPTIGLALALLIISIAFFNFASVTLSKYLSATTRMVLDSVRTLIIWIFSIPLFSEKFIPVQLLGFALLILGLFVYNDLVIGPRFRRNLLPKLLDDGENRSSRTTRFCAAFCCGVGDPGQEERLLGETGEEQNAD